MKYWTKIRSCYFQYIDNLFLLLRLIKIKPENIYLHRATNILLGIVRDLWRLIAWQHAEWVATIKSKFDEFDVRFIKFESQHQCDEFDSYCNRL